MNTTKAIVVKHLKYGDSSLIVHLYTRTHGMLAFIIKGFYKSKKKNRAMLFPMTEVEVSFIENRKSALLYPASLQIRNAFSSLYSNPLKSMILQVITEILYVVLKEDEPNEMLYDFLLQCLENIENKTAGYADFHLVLLMNLTKYLGFYPSQEERSLPVFDLQEGRFSFPTASPYALSEPQTELWKRLLMQDFNKELQINFTTKERRVLLNILLLYYQLHLPSFKEPKSLEIIKKIL